ncbi:polyketide synthase [Colletotrichum tofieldiae]|nr:polyketide synthase [Colletotrichum tofieldiae]
METKTSTQEGLAPIAIVGMSCRLPGEASSLYAFWKLMCRRRTGWSSILKNRFNRYRRRVSHEPLARSLGLNELFSDAGKTYAFDHRAKSGYVRGEGAGCLVLKPLHLALAQNDRIRAIPSSAR